MNKKTSIIDNKTLYLNLPLPNSQNYQIDDVERLRIAFQDVDANAQKVDANAQKTDKALADLVDNTNQQISSVQTNANNAQTSADMAQTALDNHVNAEDAHTEIMTAHNADANAHELFLQNMEATEKYRRYRIGNIEYNNNGSTPLPKEYLRPQGQIIRTGVYLEFDEKVANNEIYVAPYGTNNTGGFIWFDEVKSKIIVPLLVNVNSLGMRMYMGKTIPNPPLPDILDYVEVVIEISGGDFGFWFTQMESPYSLTVDWGNGVITTETGNDVKFYYETTTDKRTYTVKIMGNAKNRIRTFGFAYRRGNGLSSHNEIIEIIAVELPLAVAIPDCFYGSYNLRHPIPKDLGKTWMSVLTMNNAFEQLEKYTHELPPIWTYSWAKNPLLSHTRVFARCTKASNYAQIPADWK